MSDFKITGGCFCGANQFAITEPAVDSHHCHCSICRRLQGAPFVTLAIYPRSGFSWTSGGDLDTFDSSPTVHRHRCKSCGTPMSLTFEGHDQFGDLIAIMRTAIDDNADPGHPADGFRHAFWPDKVPWLDINDDVKKTDGFA